VILGYIEEDYFPSNKLILTWKELLLAVFKWDKNMDLKEILFYYCSEIEESYEIVIRKM
jgi:hypothetical protein